MMNHPRSLCLSAGLLFFVLRPALAQESASGPEPTSEAIVTKMAAATDELNRNETGKPVQTVQKEIVRDLDSLITSLEKKRERMNGGMKDVNPIQGMDDSRISSGPGGMGRLANPRDDGKDWGKLSSRERDRILQSMSEGFPPEYRTVLERYYRRLADEKTGAAGREAKAKPGAAPGVPAKP